MPIPPCFAEQNVISLEICPLTSRGISLLVLLQLFPSIINLQKKTMEKRVLLLSFSDFFLPVSFLAG